MSYYYNIDDLYKDELAHTLYGSVVAPRGMKTYERLGVSLTLTDPSANIVTWPSRRLGYHFMVAEFLWILLGRDDLAFIERYNARYREFSDDGVRLKGAYGPRIRPQLTWLIRLLAEDPHTRQGVISIWTPTPGPSRDVPCTIALQFLRRDEGLCLITTMRSNDLFLGLPYDVYTFTRLQAYVAAALDLPLGWYRHQVGSLHLYERDVPRVKEILATDDEEALLPIEPRLTYPYPHQLERVVEGLPETFFDVGALPEPWQTYAAVLATRFGGDLRPELLPEPWSTLIGRRRRP